MKQMLWMALSLMFAWPVQAKVTALLDQNPVVQGQAVTLTVRVVDEKGEPDLSVLNKDFRVLGQNTSSQVQYVNGKVSQWKDWNIQLLPRAVGNIEVPAISVGQAQTQPLMLKVFDDANDRPKEAWVELDVEPKTVWQGQQVLVTVRLYYVSAVRSGELSAPEVTGAIIEQLGDDQTEQINKDGVPYNRLTRRYVIFPEQPGTLKISGPVFEGQAELARAPSRGFGSLFRNTRHVAAAAKEVTLTVKAAEAGGSFWLPAQDVSLRAEWVDAAGNAVPTFRVGEPVTRIVTLTAYGLLATQLPDLQFDYSTLRAYPEAPEQDTRGSEQGVVGIRRFRTAIIPQAEGSFTVPAQTVEWWDVNRGEWAQARLDAEQIKVLPAANAFESALVNAEPCETPVVANEPLMAAASDEPVAACDGQAATVLKEPPFWRWVALIALALWLLTLLIWWKPWANSKNRTSSAAAEAGRLRAIEAAKANVIAASKTNDARAAAQALRALAHHAQLAASSPAALAVQCNAPALAKALQELDAALYGNDNDWSGLTLASALQRAHWPVMVVEQTASSLRPLYPAHK